MDANMDFSGLMANMESTPHDMPVKALHPGIFVKGWCGGFHYQSYKMRSLLFLGFISKELRDKTKVKEKFSDKRFDQRLKQVFAKEQSFIQMIQ